MAIITANNQSMTAITSLPSGVSAKSLILLATETASSSATISFTSNIDDTYKEYVFKFYDVHPASEGQFTFQADTGTNTSYNQTITSSSFRAYNYESSGTPTVAYYANGDLAQSTSFHYLTSNAGVGDDNDQSFSGTLVLYDPSNSTFVKHFTCVTNSYGPSDYTMQYFAAGYFNTTTALTRVQFKFSSGNTDSGTIKMYGVA